MDTISLSAPNHNKEANGNSVRHLFQIAHIMGYERTLIFENTDCEFLAGRSQNAQIHLPYDIISRNHAKIRIHNGICYISDLGSSNKTYVNDKVILEEYRLTSGDVIMFYDQSHTLVVTMRYSLSEDRASTKENIITIGRAKTNDIVIDHVAASRVHAEVTKEADGTCFITDNKSLNGTFVNGVRITGKTRLLKGDRIRIASAKLYFDGANVTYSVSNDGLSISAVNLTKEVVNSGKKKTILNNVSFSIQGGSFVALVGGSGAGKSTLMDCLNGFRPATGGRVIVNGEDFYENYNSYKSIIGYVPQQDVVYKNLTVKEMLSYSACLRMPEDTTNEERHKRIESVIKDVSLEGKEDLRISKLSGGQKKRVSIAVELLADPKLLFLDEPTSGLDPGLDKSMMELLSSLAKKGTTVVLITHATDNIYLCDKVVFMGMGGRLCYYGAPSGLLSHFETESVPDIYKKLSIASGKDADLILEKNALYYESKYKKTAVSNDFEADMNDLRTPVAKRKNVRELRQLFILIRRYFKLISSDMASLVLMFGQAPIMLLILTTVITNETFDFHDKAKQFLFVVSSIATIMGVLNSFIEICKERDIFRREYAVNLSLRAYVLSKFCVLGIICFIQSVILCWGITAMADLPEPDLLFATFGDFLITTYLILLASTAMGLLISAISPNTERATLYMPIIIIPQIVFSGLMFELENIKEFISWFIVNRWGISAYGSVFKIAKIEEMSIFSDIDKNVLETLDITIPGLDMFEHSVEYLLTTWGALALIVLSCAFAIYYVLKKQNTNK